MKKKKQFRGYYSRLSQKLVNWVMHDPPVHRDLKLQAILSEINTWTGFTFYFSDPIPNLA